VNLNAYLARLGLSLPLPPTAGTLRALHVAHLAAFPFDNLGIQRHDAIRVDIDSIEKKFFAGTSGGYCFEQNTLLGAALRDLGFAVSILLARVGPPEKGALNHMLLRVEIDGEGWLADVGFGADGPLEPLPLIDGARVTQDGIDYSLRRDAHFWTVTMHTEEGSEDLYAFPDAPHTTGDVEIANYYTSTHPGSIFRRTLTIQRLRRGDRTILRPRMITRYVNGVRTDTPIEPTQVRHFARELFGIELGEEPLLFEEIAASEPPRE
jgi:N-hydroxyarylamine O-acetyltransferase